MDVLKRIGVLKDLLIVRCLNIRSRHSFRLWPIFAAGLLVVSYLLYLTANRSTPIRWDEETPRLGIELSPIIPLTHDFSTAPIMLVSAFFPLPTSKHSHDEYAEWIKLFLSTITSPMVIYTTKSFSATIERLRGNLPVIIDTAFETPFDVPPLQGLEEAYTKQHAELDPERKRHNPALYATWNAKAWLVQHSVEEYAMDATEYIFWADAGALRETHVLVNWPDHERVQEVFSKAANDSGTPIDELFFIPMWDAPPSTRYTRYWKEDDGPMVLHKMSEGSLFGGQRKAVQWWFSTFYTLHDEYLAQNNFVGKDQNIFNAILFLHPEKVVTVWPRDPQRRLASYEEPVIPQRMCTWDRWYYYFYWLAGRLERRALREHMRTEYQQLSWAVRTMAWLGLPVAKAGRGECDLMKGWVFRDVLEETVGRS